MYFDCDLKIIYAISYYAINFDVIENSLSQSDKGEYCDIISDANDCDQPKDWLEILDVF